MTEEQKIRRVKGNKARAGSFWGVEYVSPSPLMLIFGHIFATYATPAKCKEILQEKISQEGPEDRCVLGNREEKPQCFRVAILEPSAK